MVESIRATFSTLPMPLLFTQCYDFSAPQAAGIENCYHRTDQKKKAAQWNCKRIEQSISMARFKDVQKHGH